jgi:hypothetical protein
MPGYLTHQHIVAIAGADDLIIRSLLDRQQFADPLGLAERMGISSATWPLFGLLWPSGAQLAARMAAHVPATGATHPGDRLRPGTGQPGGAPPRRRRDGQRQPPADRALPGANLRLNALPPMKYRHGAWAQCRQRPRSATASQTAGCAAATS